MLWNIFFTAVLAIGTLAEMPSEEMCSLTGKIIKVDRNEAPVKGFSFTDILTCVQNSIDVEVVKTDIDNAVPEGKEAVKEVLKRYCVKAPRLKTCINNVYSHSMPCKFNLIRQYLNTVLHTSTEVIDFICHDNGESVAPFFVEGGLQCVTEKYTEMFKCFAILDDNQMTVDYKAECTGAAQVRACIVNMLQSCAAQSAAPSVYQFLISTVNKLVVCIAFFIGV